MPDDAIQPGDQETGPEWSRPGAEPGTGSGSQQSDTGTGTPVPPGQPEPLPGLGDLPEPLPGLRASLEAILLVMDEPVEEVVLAQVLERPRGEVSAALRELSAEYTADGRGFDLREVAGGWRFYTRSECAPIVEKFVRDGQEARLTQAALETLAIVAYRQPVSRSRVSAVRGVNVEGVMRTLLTRGLREEAGH